MEVTVTISPSPESISLGSSARVTRSVPITLVSHIQRQCSRSASATGARPLAPPALFTSTCTAPSALTCAASASTEAWSVTSVINAVPPICSCQGFDPVLSTGRADHVKPKSGKGFRGRIADS